MRGVQTFTGSDTADGIEGEKFYRDLWMKSRRVVWTVRS